MYGGMLEAVRGCLKEEIRMDVIANNLANSNAIGFKKGTVSFQNLLNRANRRGGGTDDSALVSIESDLDQGNTRFTGNSLDFAIKGDGFFKVETPGGIRYTRKGNFSLDTQGFLVTQAGFKVMGTGGPIQISGNDIQVDGLGGVKVDGSEVGQISVVDLENYENLVKEGNALFRNSSKDREMPPPPETKIHQEYVELSNVNAAQEMINMIHSLRAFESYQKAIQVLDELDKRAINEVGRLR